LTDEISKKPFHLVLRNIHAAVKSLSSTSISPLTSAPLSSQRMYLPGLGDDDILYGPSRVLPRVR
jgi:hypothetical protein